MREDQNLVLRTMCGWCKPLSFRSSFHQPTEDMSYYNSCHGFLLWRLLSCTLTCQVSRTHLTLVSLRPLLQMSFLQAEGECNPWWCGAQFSDRFQSRRWLFSSVSGAAPSVLQAPGSSYCQQGAWSKCLEGKRETDSSTLLASLFITGRWKQSVGPELEVSPKPQVNPACGHFCIKVSVTGHNHKVILIPLPSSARSDHTQEATKADAPWNRFLFKLEFSHLRQNWYLDFCVMHVTVSSPFRMSGKQYLHFRACNLISPDSYLSASQPASSSLSVQNVP